MKSFLASYLQIAIEAMDADFTDNYDRDRFGPADGGKQPGVKEAIRRSLRNVGLITVGSAKHTVRSALRYVEPHLVELEWLYRHLGDEESRRTLVQVAAYRALGHRRIKLPLNTPGYWEARKRFAENRVGAETMETGFRGWQVYRTDLRPFGYPFELFVMGIQNEFQLQQYRCPLGNDAIEVEPGDVTVDGGGCYGDTAFYFAHKAGPAGRVYSFEFLPDNLLIFQRNLQFNPDFASRIKLVQHPMWAVSDQELFIEGSGPATRVSPQSKNPEASRIKTLSIDSLVEREQLDRLDFIKMDIEGAELEALRGAEAALRRFKPKLAITVYHNFKDFWTIPQYLHQVEPGYRFHLKHFTIHSEETVLFARIGDEARP